jgi:TrpR family trp operon transcriptional repressor
MKDSLMKNEWQKFLSLLIECKNAAKLETLLNFLLTHDERDMIATRLLLTEELLRKEKAQRAIAADYEISIALITRGSNELKRLTEQQRQELKTLLIKEQ